MELTLAQYLFKVAKGSITTDCGIIGNHSPGCSEQGAAGGARGCEGGVEFCAGVQRRFGPRG